MDRRGEYLEPQQRPVFPNDDLRSRHATEYLRRLGADVSDSRIFPYAAPTSVTITESRVVPEQPSLPPHPYFATPTTKKPDAGWFDGVPPQYEQNQDLSVLSSRLIAGRHRRVNNSIPSETVASHYVGDRVVFPVLRAFSILASNEGLHEEGYAVAWRAHAQTEQIPARSSRRAMAIDFLLKAMNVAYSTPPTYHGGCIFKESLDIAVTFDRGPCSTGQEMACPERGHHEQGLQAAYGEARTSISGLQRMRNLFMRLGRRMTNRQALGVIE
jgi:hypothetical protein